LIDGGMNVPVDALLDEPRLVRFVERLTGFCRQIWFDARGRGVSDPLAHEDRLFGESVTEDMVALIDCLDLERVAVMALAGGGGAGQLFAAVQPQRTSALVLRYPDARIAWAPDYPDGWRKRHSKPCHRRTCGEPRRPLSS
jgi:pimeloyl-ACP methyl ester carboxylesterase